MSRETNIYYGVVRNENSMTELFCNYMQFKAFRDEFLNLFLKEYEISKIKYEHFSTQYRLPNNSRPDMSIINDEIEILIEIKVDNTELTSNQPISYLKHLVNKSKKIKHLIFLIPKGYSHLNVWNKKVEQYFSIEKDYLDTKVDIVYWTDIIKVIEKADLQQISERVRDFYELLKTKFEYRYIQFEQSEVSYMYRRDIPIIISKLYTIIEEVAKHGFLDVKKELSFNTEEYGIYFKDNDDNFILYFGMWYPFWEKYSQPICFGIEEGPYYLDKVVKRFKKRHKDELIEFEHDDIIFKLCTINEALIKQDDCISKIVDIINDELKALLE